MVLAFDKNVNLSAIFTNHWMVGPLFLKMFRKFIEITKTNYEFVNENAGTSDYLIYGDIMITKMGSS